MKTLTLILVAMSFLVALVGCSGGEEGGQGTTAPANTVDAPAPSGAEAGAGGKGGPDARGEK